MDGVRIDPDTCRDPDLLAAEVRRLRAAIESEPLTLTPAEREAIHWAIGDVADITGPVEDTLRGLLERTK